MFQLTFSLIADLYTYIYTSNACTAMDTGIDTLFYFPSDILVIAVLFPGVICVVSPVNFFPLN